MPTPLTRFEHDVFLSHSSRDKPLVEYVGQRLLRAGVRPFLDKWHLVPGDLWLNAITEALQVCRTVAVFVGPSGDFGSVQREEILLAIDTRINDRNRRVIPVLLPGTPDERKHSLPPLLTRGTWVEFGDDLDDDRALNDLVNGIRGLAPGPPETDLPAPPVVFRELRGDVFHLGADGEVIPEVDIEVYLKASGDSYTTDRNGVFRLPLPGSIAAGEEIDLAIDKPGWRIRHPLEGRARVPARLDRELVRIELLPQGSPLFWTHDRIERWIADQASASARTPPETPAAERADLSKAIRTFAHDYGFPIEEVRNQLELWIKEVRTRDDDPHQLGLAAFAERSFEEAAQHFRTSSERRQFERREFLDTTDRAIVSDLRLEGDSYSAAQLYDRALDAYQRADHEVDRHRLPELWATVQVDLARAMTAQGRQILPQEGMNLLKQAVVACCQALDIFTKDELPREWAKAQHALGSALKEQGIRLGGASGVELLAQAVIAFRQALNVFSRDELPQDWATTQNALGNVLEEQGSRLGDASGVDLLAQAVTAYRQALTVRTRDELPQLWASTKVNLGNALRVRAARLRGAANIDLLSQATASFREALAVLSRDEGPQDWAAAQNSLGIALLEQGRNITFLDQTFARQGATSIELLALAVAAFREALTVRTRNELPQAWAATQSNLGIALKEQGIRTRGEAGLELLAQAVAAFREALTVRTFDELPQDWAATQNNLGNALRQQGLRLGGSAGEKLLAQAVVAFREALLIYTQEAMPGRWQVVNENLTTTLADLGSTEKSSAADTT